MSTAEDLLESRSVLVCCGSGGVGKTTVAAALGIAGAQRGRRTCIITIDPARRLADALNAKGLSNEPVRIVGAFDGELSAVMLDARATFDDLVRRYASNEAQVNEILSNAIYANLVSSLSGTQEYMATEKLFELHESGAFDLIIVDTPPSRAALDFLDAPSRLAGFIDNRIFRLMLRPQKSFFKPLSIGSQLLLRTIARVAGSEIVDDAIAFFRAFEGMEDGFKARAGHVREMLANASTAFVLITAPRRDAVNEAMFFAQRLAASHHGIDALVVNRVFPDFGGPIAPLGGIDQKSPLGVLVLNLATMSAISAREDALLNDLAALVTPAPLVRVPFLSHDVHDLSSLIDVAHYLMGEVPLERGEGAHC